MVYKKYIRRKGKRYGPYLYENKRIKGKVVTRYIGRTKNKEKENGFEKYYLLCALLILAFLLVMVFSQSYFGDYITGFQVGGEGNDTGGVPGPQGGGSFSSGDDPDQGEGVVSSGGGGNSGRNVGSGGKIDLSDSVSMEIPKVEGGGNFKVSVWEIEEDVAVVGKVASLRLPFRVSIAVVPEIIVRLPLSAKYVRIVGTERTDVSIKTVSDGLEIRLFNVKPGNRNLLFSVSAPYVSLERKTQYGEVVVLSNPLGINYEDFSVVLPLRFEVRNLEDLAVFYGRDNVAFLTYDLDNDGIFDLISVSGLKIDSNSDESLTIILKNGEVREKDISLVDSVPETDQLMPECDYSCGASYSSCSYASTSYAFEKKVPLRGQQETLCFSDSEECFPVVEYKKECSISEKIYSNLDKEGVYLSPVEIEDDSKKVSIFDGGSRVVDIVAGEDRLDIVFVESVDEVLFSPTSCYNGLLNEKEEGIDCGGPCRECVYKRSFLSKLRSYLIG